ncbi:hypothetical protein DV736_g6291, partial [Chaetothyriales sp. CBS 134916]
MAAPASRSFKPNVNRAVTKKWKEAAPVSYGGDDVTNPVPASLASQASFERGDDRRTFSAGGIAGLGFDSAYPTAQPSPFPDIEHDYEPQAMQVPLHARPPPLAVQAQGYAAARPSSRGQQRPYADAPYSSLPGAYPSQPASYSSRHESPGRPDSRSSYASAHQFPPRKSSLSTTQPAADTADTADKPTPTFIRPADIYKRLEEERERERNSLDSSRASLDLNRPTTRDSSASARSTGSDAREAVAVAPPDESDSARRLKPTLDTVVERKSEYGFDNMLKHAHDAKEAKEAADHLPTESARDDDAAEQHRYKLPPIDHSSLFSPELALLTPTVASQARPEPASTVPDLPPAVPAKDTVDYNEDDIGNLASGQPAPLALNMPPAMPAENTMMSSKNTMMPSKNTMMPSKNTMMPTKNTIDYGEDDPANLATDQPAPLALNVPPAMPAENTMMLSKNTMVPTKNTIDYGEDDPANLATDHPSPLVPPAVPAKDTVAHADADHDTANLATDQPAPLALNMPLAVPAKDTVDHADADHDTANLATDQPGQSVPLAHQPSLGYRSLVHQAFDNSQILNPLSPASRSDTVARSNSASTSDISPIITRHTDLDSNAREHSLAQQIIAEEPAATDRPLSSSTLTPTKHAADQSEPLSTPPPINIGYRRDVTPPNRDNSPAKRPISVAASHPADSTDAANVPAAAVVVDTPAELHRRDRDQASIPDTSLAHPIAHSAAGDDEEWPKDKHQPGSGLGSGLLIQDSNQTTPGLATPLFRTDSPPKGMVRNLTEKLESQSAQSSPSAATQPKRPTALASTETFRPALPGGWQSYTQSSAATTPANEDSDPLKPPTAPLESDASTPTATGPSHSNKHATSPITQAFAAAAAAGSATLAGAIAIAGLSSTRKRTEQSEDSSDDEWDKSPVTRSPEHGPADTRASDLTVPEEHLAPLSPSAESQPPTPLPKDSPIEDKTATMTADEHGYTAHEADYFPAPLRTAKAVNSRPTARPSLPTLPLTDHSSVAVDHDQLQRDIVKGLTPTSSRTDGEEAISATQDRGLDDPAATAAATAAGAVATAAAGTAAGTATATPAAHQQSTRVAPAPLSATPQLTHRFSWEADSTARATADPSTPPAADTPVPETRATDVPTAYASAADSPLSHHVSNPVANPAASTLDSPTHTQTEPSSQPVQPSDLEVRPDLPAPDGSALTNALPSAAALPQATTLRKIMDIGNHQARVDAYNHNRELYAQSDGLLGQWILSLKSHAEHADVYAPGTRPLSVTPTRPSPNRPLPSIGGGKLMQEDGKRLMAAAGRFGGKAGGAAKGLFARGKEKLRQASGDKASRAKPRGLPSGPRPFVDPGVSDASKAVGTLPTTTASFSPFTTTPIAAPAGSPHLPAQHFHASPIDVTHQTRSPGHQVDQAPARPPRPLSTLLSPSIGPAPHTDVANKSDGPTVEAVTKAPVVAEPPSTATVREDADPVAEPSARTPSQPSAHDALTVPGIGRTRSLVSEVSSASPRSVKRGDETNQDHPVSPADDQPPPEESPPSFHPPPPSTTKAVETADYQANLSPLASHPVADAQSLARTQTSKHTPPLTRPFSLPGSLDPTSPTLPPRPVSQTVTMSGSQVNVDRPNAPPGPSLATDCVRDQLAPGPPTETVDPGQLPKTASPLPSARRPQAGFEKPRVPERPRPVEPDDEELYRIPGPYHHEFRSPRQSSKPVSLPQLNQDQQGPWSSYQPLVHDNQQQQYVQQAPAPATHQNPLPPLPDGGRRKSAIGSLFRSRSKREKHEQATLYQDSPASQHSAYARTGEFVAHTPTSEIKQRRLSKDPTSALASPSPEQGEAKKKRFSALFSRGSKSGQSTRPPQRASTLPIYSTPPHTQENATAGPPNEGNNGAYPPDQQFRGAPQPVARFSPPHQDEEAYWPSHTQPYASSHMYYQQPSRATTLRIDTTNSGQSHRPIAATAPPQSHAPRDISYRSQAYVSPTKRNHANTTNISTNPTTTVPRGPSPHVVDLHKRSRSPKLGPYTDDAEPDDAQAMTSVGGLGTFSNKKISPVGGVPRPAEDQEAPFRITLPGEPADEEHRPSKQTLIEQGGGGAGATGNPPATTWPVTNPNSAAAQSHPATTTPTATTTHNPSSTFVAELPGSRATGYESDDDVQMSATAYPGQWQDPVYSDESRWED